MALKTRTPTVIEASIGAGRIPDSPFLIEPRHGRLLEAPAFRRWWKAFPHVHHAWSRIRTGHVIELVGDTPVIVVETVFVGPIFLRQRNAWNVPDELVRLRVKE